MINILSYVGMSFQNEVCFWTLLGLLRTIFDATLFKVNANLKQVWHMTMPPELSMSVQRVLRTMISGVMLVQCFTVYVYLATYIVLLYPVFLEERPTLVLPWLLLAAVRKLLCELTSLALGLGTCVLLGAARPPCIKFLIIKMTSIIPAFYMWMLVLSYYHSLKMTVTFKTFPVVLPPSDRDFGLEMAIRRRKTKSLQGEEQLRHKLIARFYGERSQSPKIITQCRLDHSSRAINASDDSFEEIKDTLDIMKPHSMTSNRNATETIVYEDWFGKEIVKPRDTDRVLEQLGLMLLRIGAYLDSDEAVRDKLFSTQSPTYLPKDSQEQSHFTQTSFDSDPPAIVGSQGKQASYLSDYPQIFNKKSSDLPFNLQSDHTISLNKGTRESKDNENIIRNRKHTASTSSAKTLDEGLLKKREVSTQSHQISNETETTNSNLPTKLEPKADSASKSSKNNEETGHDIKQVSEATSTDSHEMITERTKNYNSEEHNPSKTSVHSNNSRRTDASNH